MLKLAAFADEISPDLDTQIRVCRENGVRHVELRGVDGVNVLDFDATLRRRIKESLVAAGMAVACIGSPIGKVKISEPWDAHLARFKIAVETAEFFNAPMIRIFSYYPPDGQDIRAHRAQVLERMRAKLAYLGARPITLVHENERDIFGQDPPQCVDLMRSIDSPRFRFAFDFANFVCAGHDPLAAWPELKPYTVHIHVKDALLKTGKIVPAGEGDGKIGEILADAWAGGYRGFLSLEPHLAFAGRSHGETGPELFKVAADALKSVCRKHGVPLAG